MKASVVDLRYKMNDILKALKRNEEVHVLYRGHETAMLVPIHKYKGNVKAEEHPLFGSAKADKNAVSDLMDELRKGRYDDI